MAPQGYYQARQNSNKEVVEVDHRPYWPFLKVETTTLDSVKEVAAKVILGADASSSNNWKEHLQVKPVTGGNTNQLFQVSGWNQILQKKQHDGKTCIGDSVLVRIFGAEGIIDRDVENSTYAALWQKSLVPTYYGRFANGRIEAFLDDMRPLKDEEMADSTISPMIAQQMAHLHSSFQIPDELNEYHSEPRLWKELGEWMAQALAIETFKTKGDKERAKELIDLSKIPGEMDWLKQSVVPEQTETAFCHNDVLASNIMYSEQRREIQLIDFEYGGVNFVAFDIANHFNEFAGGTDHGTPNYDFFPSIEFQREFIKQYLVALDQYKGTDTSSISEDRINAFLDQVQAFVLVDHLYWGLWGVNQGATEGTQEFDYLLYGSHRINEYYRQKKKLMEKL